MLVRNIFLVFFIFFSSSAFSGSTPKYYFLTSTEAKALCEQHRAGNSFYKCYTKSDYYMRAKDFTGYKKKGLYFFHGNDAGGNPLNPPDPDPVDPDPVDPDPVDPEPSNPTPTCTADPFRCIKKTVIQSFDFPVVVSYCGIDYSESGVTNNGTYILRLYSNTTVPSIQPTTPDTFKCDEFGQLESEEPNSQPEPPLDPSPQPDPDPPPISSPDSCTATDEQRSVLDSVPNGTNERSDCPDFLIDYYDSVNSCQHTVRVHPAGTYFDIKSTSCSQTDPILPPNPPPEEPEQSPYDPTDPNDPVPPGQEFTPSSPSGGGSSGGSNSPPLIGGGSPSPPSPGSTVPEVPTAPPGAGEACDPSIENCDSSSEGILQDILDVIDFDDEGQLADIASDILNAQDNVMGDQEEISNIDLEIKGFNVRDLFTKMFDMPKTTKCSGTFDEDIFGYQFKIDPCVKFQLLRDLLSWVFFVLGGLKIYALAFGQRLI